MKYLKILLLIPSLALADSMEFNVSFLTTHLVGSSEKVASLYKNKLNNRGVLNNTALGYSLTKKRNRYTIFAGENSVGEPLVGFKYSRVSNITTYIELNWTLGGYGQNGNAFPGATKVCDSNTCRNLGPAPHLLPIIGLDLNFYLYRGKSFFIRQNNLITPVITNHGISIGGFYDN